MMRVLITGANGFLGKNLQQHLAERKDVRVSCFARGDDLDRLPAMLETVDFVFHLAGVNRPQDPAEFVSGNVGLTHALCQAAVGVAQGSGRKIAVVYTSSTQADRGNDYGQSKKRAEDVLFAMQREHAVPVHVFRLPNVFGKWCKPNYNSAVATFCHNIARGLPITVNDPAAPITLVYVDDVINAFVQLMDGADARVAADGFASVAPQYSTTVGDLAKLIHSFRDSRRTLMTERVGVGLVRALYATYVSYLPTESFAYSVPQCTDSRGMFVDMLKTPDCGQFSCFTSQPGVTRGSCYHHSKTEKLLVIKGEARFRFRHLQTGQLHEIDVSGEKAKVVDIAPGWTHEITNIGTKEMVVILWANEALDRKTPDSFDCPV